MSLALPVAIAIVKHPFENSILLIRRTRGAYKDYLALPGGKIEREEHLREAIIRELYEESKLNCSFKRLLGVVSELYYEDEALKNHFLLHICQLNTDTADFISQSEGDLGWYDLQDINKYKDEIVPSDLEIIQKFFIKKKQVPIDYNEIDRDLVYFESILIKKGNKYLIKRR